jgi:hypothetical protein
MRGKLIMREKAGLINRDACFPIAGTAAGVGDGEDMHTLRFILIKDDVWKTREHAAPESSLLPVIPISN